MTKIDFTKVDLANVEVSNESQEGRTYDIKATAQIRDGRMLSLTDGTIRRDGEDVGGFSVYGERNVQTNLYGVDAEDQPTLYTEILAFHAAVREASSKARFAVTVDAQGEYPYQGDQQ